MSFRGALSAYKSQNGYAWTSSAQRRLQRKTNIGALYSHSKTWASHGSDEIQRNFHQFELMEFHGLNSACQHLIHHFLRYISLPHSPFRRQNYHSLNCHRPKVNMPFFSESILASSSPQEFEFLLVTHSRCLWSWYIYMWRKSHLFKVWNSEMLGQELQSFTKRPSWGM